MVAFRPVMLLLSALLLAMGTLALPGPASNQSRPQKDSPGGAWFQEVGNHAGLGFRHINGMTPEKHLPETMSGGALFFDFNNDGWPDIYLVDSGSLLDRKVASQARSVLYRNNREGTFSDVTAKSRIQNPHYGMGACAADYDNDGWVDLYLTNFGPDALWRNNGDATFTDVAQQAGIKDPGHYGFGVIFSDFDNDGWPDIYVANDSVPNFLFHNNRDGTFTEMGLLAGVALSEDGRYQAGMGLDSGDYNNDGFLDIFVTNFSHDSNTLYQNNGDGTFTDRTFPLGLGEPSLPYLGWGAGFLDIDNDGFLDIFVANGHVYPEIDNFSLGTKFLQRKQLFLNLRNGRFREVSDQVGGGLLLGKSSRGAAFADYDNDGDIDALVINMNDRPTLLRTDPGNGNHWVTFRLIGTKSNRDAIGARVTLEAEEHRQVAEVRSGGSYLSHNDSRLHFGLGAASRVRRVEVRWPSGLVETFEDLGVDQFHQLREGQGIVPVRPSKQ